MFNNCNLLSIKSLVQSFLFSLSLLSCKNNETKKPAENISIQTDSPKISPAKPEIEPKLYDSIPRFIVDDYPVTEEMFKGNYYNRKSGEMISSDKAWFTNDTLAQTLTFELYTDYHRLVIYHFMNNDIPTSLINRMELHINGEPANEKQKQKNFRGIVAQSKKIAQSYFISDKGFKLGDEKEKILKIYGNPDKTKIDNGIEKCEWDFIGDIVYDGKTNLKGKPLAEDSFGHQAIMFFRNNKLIAMIFHNDIP